MAERLLTIGIRKYLVKQPRTKRTKKAIKYIRERVAHYTKTKVENVKLSQELNQLIHKRYARRMTPVKLNVKIENNIANVTHFSEKAKPPQAAPEKKGILSKIVTKEAVQPPPTPEKNEKKSEKPGEKDKKPAVKAKEKQAPAQQQQPQKS